MRLDLKHFTLSELECKCGCGSFFAHEEALTALEQLREAAAVPLVVASATRCPVRNRTVGGAPASYHLRGMAFDLIWPRMAPLRFLGLAHEAGFRGLGVYGTFVHLDVGSTRVWAQGSFPGCTGA